MAFGETIQPPIPPLTDSAFVLVGNKALARWCLSSILLIYSIEPTASAIEIRPPNSIPIRASLRVIAVWWVGHNKVKMEFRIKYPHSGGWETHCHLIESTYREEEESGDKVNTRFCYRFLSPMSPTKVLHYRRGDVHVPIASNLSVDVKILSGGLFLRNDIVVPSLCRQIKIF